MILLFSSANCGVVCGSIIELPLLIAYLHHDVSSGNDKLLQVANDEGALTVAYLVFSRVAPSAKGLVRLIC